MDFKIKFNKLNRKALAEAISEITESDLIYIGEPNMAYKIDYFTVDKNGVLSFDDRADSEEIENLIEKLVSKGFDIL